MDTFLLFVYGTLKRGGVRNFLLRGQKFLGEARTVPRYALYDLGAYPGLVQAEEDGQVVYGELYEVEQSLLPRLDAVEGAPTLFRLEQLELQGHDRLVRSYFYQRATTGWSRLASGLWVNAPSG